MGIYKMGLSTSKMSGGSKNVGYGMGKSMARTSMSKVSVGKGAGNTLKNRPAGNGDPKGKSKC